MFVANGGEPETSLVTFSVTPCLGSTGSTTNPLFGPASGAAKHPANIILWAENLSVTSLSFPQCKTQLLNDFTRRNQQQLSLIQSHLIQTHLSSVNQHFPQINENTVFHLLIKFHSSAYFQ